MSHDKDLKPQINSYNLVSEKVFGVTDEMEVTDLWVDLTQA